MKTCAKCGKQLLSHASARCSWCGQIIDDAAYQAQANVERAAYFAHTAAQDAPGCEAWNILSTSLDPATLAPIAHTRRWEREQAIAAARLAAAEKAQADAEAAKNPPIKDETEEAEERFRHLEIG